VKRAIEFTAVDLRDGEQQVKRFAKMPTADRLRVFDALVEMGMRRIEIGHLSNEADQELAQAIIGHVRDEDVELQVLFGSRRELIEPGLAVLGGFDPERVVAHVYDRAPACLRNLAREPYSIEESAGRIVAAGQEAIRLGYRRFSVSGEGAVDPFLDPDELIDKFYIPVARGLYEAGATEVNINLANTFGSSPIDEWDERGLREFNRRVKAVDPTLTTSVHAHDDYGSAAEFALAAVIAGFDRIETTVFGMGERRGNTAAVAVMARLLEWGRVVSERAELGRGGRGVAFWEERSLSRAIATSLPRWYAASTEIAGIYGTRDRLERTLLGDPYAFDAGSGPHGQAYAVFAESPADNPVWENYDRNAIPLYIMGRPEAREVIEVDEARIKAVTIQTHAVGRHSRRVHTEGGVEFASESQRQLSVEMARERVDQVLEIVGGVVGMAKLRS
jgi:hypothetical protein